MQIPHVVNWSTASVQWAPGGTELTAYLVESATARQVAAIADALEEHLAGLLRDHEITVLPFEPEDAETAQLAVLSPTLLQIDPGYLRHQIDLVADAVANEVGAEAAADDQAMAQWLTALRKSG